MTLLSSLGELELGAVFSKGISVAPRVGDKAPVRRGGAYAVPVGVRTDVTVAA